MSWERLDGYEFLVREIVSLVQFMELKLILVIMLNLNIICSGALVSHAFELDSKVQTLFYGAPAVITFRVPTKAALQV